MPGASLDGFSSRGHDPIRKSDNNNGSPPREDRMKSLKAVLVTFALVSSLAGAAHGQTPGQAVEKKQLTLAVGGKTALYYLPLTICERLGYFKEQGLEVAAGAGRGVGRHRHRGL
jgi:hypothetical protein